MAKIANTGPTDAPERAARAAGARVVCGVDEAGRGPLAGPVVAAAVVLPEGHGIIGLDDSKRLNGARRAALFDSIITQARSVAFAALPADVIDRENIRAASLRAMSMAVAGLGELPDFALIDGNALPPDLPCGGQAIVKGDSLSQSIAAASIIAKVMRDRMMERAAIAWPGYGFERHAGYPTAAHRAALMELGPCPIHRRTFGPVRAALEANESR